MLVPLCNHLGKRFEHLKNRFTHPKNRFTHPENRFTQSQKSFHPVSEIVSPIPLLCTKQYHLPITPSVACQMFREEESYL